MLYHNNTFLKKTVAVLVLLSFINQLTIPTALALTSGPTMPEATSFEPVDTSDIVNPLTGDMVYNLPLIEVPGPEGGYPLSLSNHAGIQPNEDASWVGLGWTLNPGAITRNVQGFPDDWYGANSSRRDFWEGGTKTVSNYGVTIPYPGIGGINFGLSFSNDTYQGHGVGWNLGVQFGIKKTPLAASIGIGVSAEDLSPYAYGSLGAVAGDGKTKIGAGLQFSTNFQSVNVGAYASASQSGLGISMNSFSETPTFSYMGISASMGTENALSGGIRSSTKTTSLDLYLVSYNRSKTRYWSNETQESSMFGSLHPRSYAWGEIPDSHAFDSYSLQEEGKGIIDSPDPLKDQGGAFPNFDSYSVTAQGLGGVMRPYQFTGEILSQSRVERVGSNSSPVETVASISNSLHSTPEFRFDHDFSNSYLQNYPDFPWVDDRLIYQSPNFQVSDYYYQSQPEWSNGVNGNKLAGSKDIYYYVTKWDGTVWENSGEPRFITPVVNGGLNRRAHTYQAETANHIAGFSITNDKGVTYHYNLPAYAYNEETYQENTEKGLAFNRQVKNEGYAYTWYLTAITGPDYVDRGTIGQIDNEDWGYYVSFEYGKWSDSYAWRTPSEGFNKDDDSRFRNVSMGYKETYYLNAIRTRSHVALFEKDVRLDGKGASPAIFNKNYQGDAQTNYQNEGVYDINSSQSLKLDRIYLLNASDANLVSTSSGSTTSYQVNGRNIYCSSCELSGGVLDKSDIDAVGRSLVESKAVRIIDFNYDYSLARGTVNSFDINGSASSKMGKLTLNSVKFKGKGGSSLLPSVDFFYELNEGERVTAYGTVSGNTLTTSEGNLNVGDLLETAETNPVFCGVIVGKTANGTNSYVYTLKNSDFTAGGYNTFRTTKNPPYNKDRYDCWGMYKGDYVSSGNESFDRKTSSISNNSTDVWSLRRVKTALGSQLTFGYEGDTYSQIVLNKNNNSFIIGGFTFDPAIQNFHFTVNNPQGYDLSEVFKSGDPIDLTLLQENTSYMTNAWLYRTLSSNNYSSPTITQVSGNTIYIVASYDFATAIRSKMSNVVSCSIATGNVGVKQLRKFYGGGVRVNRVTIDNLSGVKTSTIYSYTKPDGNISGVTSYEPTGLAVDNVRTSVRGMYVSVSVEDWIKEYRRELYKGASDLYGIAREVPPPGVMYEYVTVQSEVENAVDKVKRQIEGKTTMQFEVFRENMVGRRNVDNPDSAPRSANETYYTRNIVLKRFIAGIGSLKRIINYDNFGRKIREQVKYYLHDGLEQATHEQFISSYENRLAQFKYQGLLKERFTETKSVWTGNSSYWDIKATLAAREEYPAIQIGQSTYDYVNGVRTQTDVLAFDFYSGSPTQIMSTDPYGNRFLEESVPAYTKYPEMGPKVVPSTFNKHMLSQLAGKYLYSVDSYNNKQGLISASINVWGKNAEVFDRSENSLTQNGGVNGNVWRSISSYSWLPEGQSSNGMTSINNFNNFNWSSPTASGVSWKKIRETTLYDIFSKPLQTINISNIPSMVKLGYNSSKIALTGSGANYYQASYCGAEDALVNGKFSGNISLGAGTVSTNTAHTGLKSLLVSSNGNGFLYNAPYNKLGSSTDYILSVWVKGEYGDVSNARLYYNKGGQNTDVINSPNFQKVAGGWYLLEMIIPASEIANGVNGLTVGVKNYGVGNNLYFDDFRFQPLQASTTAHVYDTFTGDLTYILDNNNLFIKFEYDAVGRLIKTYKEVLGRANAPLIKETDYHYSKAAN